MVRLLEIILYGIDRDLLNEILIAIPSDCCGWNNFMMRRVLSDLHYLQLRRHGEDFVRAAEASQIRMIGTIVN